MDHFLGGMMGIKTRDAGWEASMLSRCDAAPPPPQSFKFKLCLNLRIGLKMVGNIKLADHVFGTTLFTEVGVSSFIFVIGTYFVCTVYVLFACPFNWVSKLKCLWGMFCPVLVLPQAARLLSIFLIGKSVVLHLCEGRTTDRIKKRREKHSIRWGSNPSFQEFCSTTVLQALPNGLPGIITPIFIF